MNMNKTILAALITTTFSSNVLAQKVDIEQANLATEKTIHSQMESIDTATMAKLNAQNSKIAELDGKVYKQDESGMWKAIGGGALGLTAALFSGSSSGGNSSPSVDDDFPIADNDTPGFPGIDNDIPRDINLITHGDTAYMYVNGEEVRTATLDVTSEGNYTITGSEGAMFHVTNNDVGKDVLVTMVNGESVKLHNVNRTDDRNISFSVEGENYNLHRTYSGEVWVQKEQGNGTGNWATVKTGADVLANIQERQLINAIDKTLPDVDNKPIQPDNDLKAQWSIGEDEKGRKALMNNGEVVAYVANDGTRLRNADNEPLGLITSSINGNGATTYSVTLNNNSQFEGATITYREGNAGNQNFTVTTADGQTTYHWRQDRGFYKMEIDNGWGEGHVPEGSGWEHRTIKAQMTDFYVFSKANGLENLETYFKMQSIGRVEADEVDAAAFNILTSEDLKYKHVVLMNNIAINGETGAGDQMSMFTHLINYTMRLDEESQIQVLDRINSAFGSDLSSLAEVQKKAADLRKLELSVDNTNRVIRFVLDKNEHGLAWTLKDRGITESSVKAKYQALSSEQKVKVQSLKTKIQTRFN